MINFNLRIFLIITLSTFCLSGCLESKFQLAKESRLPKWFIIPDDTDRNNFTVSMEMYSTFSGWEVYIKIYKNGYFFYHKKITITSETQSMVKLKPPHINVSDGYPRYFAITVDGITDIVELRKMEPLFYMTDDPLVWKEAR